MLRCSRSIVLRAATRCEFAVPRRLSARRPVAARFVARRAQEAPRRRLALGGAAFAACAALLLSAALAPRVAAQASTLRTLDDAPAFAEMLDAWMPAALETVGIVPAMAVVVVVDGEVVVADAWGTADAATGEPATADTQFYIASMTKSFTALAATMLHARGELDLDSPFSEHLHGVEVDAAIRADEVLLHDFLTHSSGVQNGPIAFRLAYTGEHDADTLWRLLGSSVPNTDAPLGTYEYTNVGYNILGMIMDRETGKVWQDQLRDLIFEPLGMTRTTAYASLGPREGWPLAVPHFGLDPERGVIPLALRKDDSTMQSAGGLMTTAHDMARWLAFQLDAGALDGEQLVPAQLVRATHERLVTNDRGSGSPFGETGYGLGWSHGSVHGRALLSHGGGYPGYRSVMSFLPEERVAVAAMVNEGSLGGDLMADVVQQCYAWWLGERDAFDDEVVEGIVAQRARFLERQRETLAQRAERTWQLARPRAAYTGRFVNEFVGTLEVTDLGDEFELTLGRLRCTSTPFPQAESMRVELVPGSGRVAIFEPADGAVERVVLDGDPFTRVE